jgi:hypothetical protein
MSIGPTIARKRHVQVEQAAILAWLDEQHAATLRDRRAQCHRRKADGLVAQGKLTVVIGSRIEKDGSGDPAPLQDQPRRPGAAALIRRRPGARIGGRGEIAQLVEHATENRGVGGSSPPLAIAWPWPIRVWAGDACPPAQTPRNPQETNGMSGVPRLANGLQIGQFSPSSDQD